MTNKQTIRKRTKKILSLFVLLIMLIIMFTKTVRVNAKQEPLKSSKQELVNMTSISENTNYISKKIIKNCS